MQKKLTMKILFLDQNYEPCLGSDTINELTNIYRIVNIGVR